MAENRTSVAVGTMEILSEEKPFAVWKKEMNAIKEKYKRMELFVHKCANAREPIGGEALRREAGEVEAFDPVLEI